MKYVVLILSVLMFVGCGTTKSVGKLCGTDKDGNTIEFVAVDFEGLSGHSKVIMRVVRSKDGTILANEPIWSGGGSSVWPSVISGGAQVGTGYYIGRGLEKSGDSTTNNNSTTASGGAGGTSTANGGNATAGAAAAATSRSRSRNTNNNANLNANVN